MKCKTKTSVLYSNWKSYKIDMKLPMFITEYYIFLKYQLKNLPPWQQNIFSSTIAAIGKQLKQSVKVFHSLILYLLLPRKDLGRREQSVYFSNTTTVYYHGCLEVRLARSQQKGLDTFYLPWYPLMYFTADKKSCKVFFHVTDTALKWLWG